MENEPTGMDRTTLDQVRDGALELADMLALARDLVPEPDGRAALAAGLRELLFTKCRDETAPVEDLERVKIAIRRVGALGRGLSGIAEPDPLISFWAQMEGFADFTADLMAFNESYAADRLRDMPHFHACLTELVERGVEGKLDRQVLLASLGLSQSNLTRVLNTLEKDRLIRRRPNDRRGVTVEITKLGRKLEFDWSDRSAQRRELVPEPLPERPRLDAVLETSMIPGLERTVYPTQPARQRILAR